MGADTASAGAHAELVEAARLYASTVGGLPRRPRGDTTNAYEGAVTQQWDDQGCHLDAVVHAVAAPIEDGRGEAIFGGEPKRYPPPPDPTLPPRRHRNRRRLDGNIAWTARPGLPHSPHYHCGDYT